MSSQWPRAAAAQESAHRTGVSSKHGEYTPSPCFSGSPELGPRSSSGNSSRSKTARLRVYTPGNLLPSGSTLDVAACYLRGGPTNAKSYA